MASVRRIARIGGPVCLSASIASAAGDTGFTCGISSGATAGDCPAASETPVAGGSARSPTTGAGIMAAYDVVVADDGVAGLRAGAAGRTVGFFAVETTGFFAVVGVLVVGVVEPGLAAVGVVEPGVVEPGVVAPGALDPVLVTVLVTVPVAWLTVWSIVVTTLF